MRSLKLDLNFLRLFKIAPPLAVSLTLLIFIEEKGKATLMLKPEAKRKRGNISILMSDEEKSEAH